MSDKIYQTCAKNDKVREIFEKSETLWKFGRALLWNFEIWAVEDSKSAKEILNISKIAAKMWKCVFPRYLRCPYSREWAYWSSVFSNVQGFKYYFSNVFSAHMIEGQSGTFNFDFEFFRNLHPGALRDLLPGQAKLPRRLHALLELHGHGLRGHQGQSALDDLRGCIDDPGVCR